MIFYPSDNGGLETPLLYWTFLLGNESIMSRPVEVEGLYCSGTGELLLETIAYFAFVVRFSREEGQGGEGGREEHVSGVWW